MANGRMCLVAVAILAGCNPPEPIEVDDSLSWKEQADGSVLASSVEEMGTRIVRCYPKGQQADCLEVFAFQNGMMMLNRELRAERDVPNGRSSDFDKSQVGYSCNIYLEGGLSGAAIGEDVKFLNERISSEKGTLLENSVQTRPLYIGGNEPWSASYVDKFMSENALDANRLWFDCGKVAEIIDGGSIASLETNLFKYDEIFEDE